MCIYLINGSKLRDLRRINQSSVQSKSLPKQLFPVVTFSFVANEVPMIDTYCDKDEFSSCEDKFRGKGSFD